MKEVYIYKIEDIKEIMGIGRDKAYALMKSSGFPSLKIGSTYFVTAENFQRWLNDYAGKEFML